jgi:hypothetical protein
MVTRHPILDYGVSQKKKEEEEETKEEKMEEDEYEGMDEDINGQENIRKVE